MAAKLRRRCYSPTTLGLLAGVILLTGAGCQTFGDLKKRTYESARSVVTRTYDDPNSETKLAEAERLFEAKEYKAAQSICRDVASNTLNPVLTAEKARFLDAECYRNDRYYPEAVDTYHRMLIDFPAGAYRERACQEIFKIADYWLDDTRAEIQAVQNGEKAINKKLARLIDFDRTKPTLDLEGRALQALEYVQTNDITGPLADKALFWAGYVHYYRGNYIDADHFFSMLIEMHKDSPLRPMATELAIISKNNSTGGAVYDGQKAAEALQLVHHAQASMPEFNRDGKPEFLTRQMGAIRGQQAEKDFKMAAYYEQTDHPGSAYFYYEIVRRRYPGTDFATKASERMDVLRERAEFDAANPPKESMLTMLRRRIGLDNNARLQANNGAFNTTQSGGASAGAAPFSR